MSKDLGELIVKLGADLGELKSGLNAARSEMASFKEQATSFGETVKKALAFAGVAVGIWEVAGALKEFAKSAALTGARTESLGIAMTKVGENAGLSTASLNYYVQQLKKAGITTQESMSAIVTAMVSGIDLTQLQALATRARDVAVLAGKNTSETLQTIMHALVSRQMEVIRNLNVPMANYEDAVKKISRSLNIDKDQIDSVTLANALLKEFMESSKGAAGAAEAADKSVDKQMKTLARYAEEAKNSLWAFFEPIMQAGVQALASYWKEMEKWAKDNEAALRNLGTTIGEVIRKKLEMVGAVLKWMAANAELLAGLLKLYAIAKIAGYITAIGSACVGAAASVGVLTGSLTALQALISGPWKLIITVAVFGLYEAYQGILAVQSAARINAAKSGAIDTRTGKPEGLGLVTPIGGGTSKQEIMGPPKQLTDVEAKEFYKAVPEAAPVADAKDKAVASAEQAAKEAEAARKKAQEAAKANMAPPKGGGGGKGGGGKEPKVEDYTRLIEKELKAQLDLEEAKADQSLKLLKENQDKKKAMLKQEFEEGKMDGAAYYAALEAMEKESTAGSLALIDQKIAAENKLYPVQLQAVQNSAKLSPEAKSLEINAMRLEHETRLVKLQGERQAAGIEGEKKLADLLREQTAWREKINDLMAQTAEDNALGPIAEKEAEINRYLRERARLRREIPEELQGQFDKDTQAGVWKKTTGEEIEGWASTIANGFKTLFESISEGTANLKTAVNSFFKSLFSQSLEKGFKQLTQWITDALSQMFSSIGSGFAGAVMGAIGLIGMMLTSSGSKSTWSASGATSGVTNTNTALRGVIAGESTIAIGEIGESLADALLPSERYLAVIARNTGQIASGLSVSVDVSGITEAIQSAMEEYFRQALVKGA